MAAGCLEVAERMSLKTDPARMTEMAQRWLDLAHHVSPTPWRSHKGETTKSSPAPRPSNTLGRPKNDRHQLGAAHRRRAQVQLSIQGNRMIFDGRDDSGSSYPICYP